MTKSENIPSSVPSCVAEIALVDGITPIPDAQITATSVFDASHTQLSARLHSTLDGGGWCGNPQDTNMYIMVRTLYIIDMLHIMFAYYK